MRRAGETRKGQTDQYTYEASNVRPGEAPTSVWVSMGVPDGIEYDMIALVGEGELVMEFALRLERAKVPGYAALVRMVPGGDPYGVFLAGAWPKATAKATVTQLSDHGRAGPREWAVRYAKAVDDPQRLEPPMPDQELARMLVGVYLDQCRRVTAS